MKEQESKQKNLEIAFLGETEMSLIKGASDLVNHFNQQGLMLPVTNEDYTKLAKAGTLVVAKNLDGLVVATASYTQFYDKNIWEFGGWAVAEEYQHQGLGLKLVKKLFSEKPHYQTIAFGNKNSGPILESLGAVAIGDHSLLPKKAFDLCATCPNKPKIGCCDVIYNLEPVVASFAAVPFDEMSPRQIDRLVYGLGEPQSYQFAGFGKELKDWE